LLRNLHRDVDECLANTAASSRTGEDGPTRRTASKNHGGAPAKMNPATRCTRAPTNHTRGFLTARRSWTAASRRRGNSDGGARARRPARVWALAAAGSGAARVSGEGPKVARRRLNRGAEAPGSVGPAREAGPRRRRRWRGARRVRVGLGREVGDDTRVPRVSLSGAGRLRWAAVGRSRLGWAAASGRGGRAGGSQADFERWAAAKNRTGRLFSHFFFLNSNSN
jgi:hypothetical protein